MKTFLIEHYWYDSYELLGAYNNLIATQNHLNDKNFRKQWQYNAVIVRMIGIRSTKQLKKVYQRYLYLNDKYQIIYQEGKK